jgi:hypothetical protein
MVVFNLREKGLGKPGFGGQVLEGETVLLTELTHLIADLESLDGETDLWVLRHDHSSAAWVDDTVLLGVNSKPVAGLFRMLVVVTNTSIVNLRWFDSNKKDLFKAGSAVIDGTEYGATQ